MFPWRPRLLNHVTLYHGLTNCCELSVVWSEQMKGVGYIMDTVWEYLNCLRNSLITMCLIIYDLHCTDFNLEEQSEHFFCQPTWNLDSKAVPLYFMLEVCWPSFSFSLFGKATVTCSVLTACPLCLPLSKSCLRLWVAWYAYWPVYGWTGLEVEIIKYLYPFFCDLRTLQVLCTKMLEVT